MKRFSILFIDDAEHGEVFADMFRSHGYISEHAYDLTEALAYLKNMVNPIVFLDCYTKGVLTAKDYLETIVGEHSNLKFVIVSGSPIEKIDGIAEVLARTDVFTFLNKNGCIQNYFFIVENIAKSYSSNMVGGNAS